MGSYCWVCFRLELTNRRLHAHVVAAHGDLYLRQHLVDSAHRSWRRRVVREFFSQRVEPQIRPQLLEHVTAALAAPELKDPDLPRIAVRPT